MGLLKGVHDAELTTVYKTAVEDLGTIRFGPHGEVYQFVYVDDDVDVTAACSVMGLADNVVSEYAVTPDRAAGSGLTKALTNASCIPVAGVAMFTADVSEGERYGWIQVKGRHAGGFTTDGSVVAGIGIVAHVSTDGAAQIANYETDGDPTDNTSSIFAIAIEADDATPVAGEVLLNCLGV